MELNKEVFLKDELVTLRPLRETDVTGRYAHWLNDPEITAYNSHGRFPMTEASLYAYVQATAQSNTTLVLAILENEQGTHVGNISLQQINWVDRNAEIAFLLGERDFWGKGLMLKAGKLLLDHGFNALNLHRIYCGTSSANAGMRRLAEKLGMIQEGIRKEAIFKNGEYHDIIEFGILK